MDGKFDVEAEAGRGGKDWMLPLGLGAFWVDVGVLLPPADSEAAVKGLIERFTSVFTRSAPAPPPKFMASWKASNHSSLFSLDSANTVMRSFRMISTSKPVSALES